MIPPTDQNYWAIERLRLLLLVIAAALGGLVTGYWLASLTVALIVFIGWSYYKLHELNLWLRQGAKQREIPDSNGAWERIAQYVQNLQRGNTRQKKRLAKTLKRFRGIITGLPYATVVLNRQNEIDWANQKSADYLGIRAKVDRGQRIENLLRQPALQGLFRARSRAEVEVSLPGSDRILGVQLIPVQKDLKLLIARDISDRVRMQRVRKTFIANASHELRSPLTVVSGYLEIMQHDEQLPPHLRTAVDAAVGQSRQMAAIVEDLLMLSRLENTELGEDQMVWVDVPSLIHSVCLDLSGIIDPSKKTLQCDIESDLKIKGSESEILSVCNNLITNALRHTPEGTQVKVGWRTSGEHACLTVQDFGQGIAPEHIPRLTERFYRVDKGRSRDQGGTGLGLAIVQHIMQRHHGELKIDSTVGEGSTFEACFRLS